MGRRKKRKWKRVIGASIAVSVSLILIIFIFLADFDGDGLKNLDEIHIGTSVFNSDTDDDGLSDGLEVNTYGTDPLILDTDDDGLSDGLEVNTYGTDPLIMDTDDDGLSDGLEVNTYRTNPLITDSDNDGLDDETEVIGYSKVFELTSPTFSGRFYNWVLEYKVWNGSSYLTYYSWLGNSWTWPYDRENILIDTTSRLVTSNPLSIDTDGDGVDDKMEYEIGTDPRSEDTDNDGLGDLAEFVTYKTIPQFYDTDGDLLGDGEEVNVYFTDPLNWDSDNDHLNDGIEVKGYDADGDNITDVDLPAFGADPLVKDIFVEVDWMPPGNKLGSYAKGKLVDVFAEHGIVLHIDYGEFDGGAETGESVNILYDNIDGPMNDLHDFKEKYFTVSRRGIFYWCLMATNKVYSEGNEVGGFNDGTIFVVAGTWTSVQAGSVFMHELGHGLGLGENIFDGIDSKKYSFSEYRSVMNYNAPLDFYDYSDGPPFDDWAHLNFKRLVGRSTQNRPHE